MSGFSAVRRSDHPLAPLADEVEAAPRPAGRLRPAPDLNPLPDQEKPLFPWEDEDLGGLAAFFLTLKGVLLRPRRFFDRHRAGARLYPAFTFGLVALGTGLMFDLFWPALPLVKAARLDAWQRLAFSWRLLALGLTPLAAAIFLLVVSAWVHLGLMLFRADHGGSPATLRSLAYASGLGLGLALPGLGPLFCLWGLVVLVVGLSRLHRASVGRIVLALIGPNLILLAGMFLLGLGLNRWLAGVWG